MITDQQGKRRPGKVLRALRRADIRAGACSLLASLGFGLLGYGISADHSAASRFIIAAAVVLLAVCMLLR